MLLRLIVQFTVLKSLRKEAVMAGTALGRAAQPSAHPSDALKAEGRSQPETLLGQQ